MCVPDPFELVQQISQLLEASSRKGGGGATGSARLPSYHCAIQPANEQHMFLTGAATDCQGQHTQEAAASAAALMSHAGTKRCQATRQYPASLASNRSPN